MILNVTDRDGKTHALDAPEGWRAMEVIRDYAAEMQAPALAVKAECGGALACATCHVYVDAAWVDRIPAPSPEERDLLDDQVFGLQETSRLSCQILTAAALDGLALTLAPGSEP